MLSLMVVSFMVSVLSGWWLGVFLFILITIHLYEGDTPGKGKVPRPNSHGTNQNQPSILASALPLSVRRKRRHRRLCIVLPYIGVPSTCTASSIYPPRMSSARRLRSDCAVPASTGLPQDAVRSILCEISSSLAVPSLSSAHNTALLSRATSMVSAASQLVAGSFLRALTTHISTAFP